MATGDKGKVTAEDKLEVRNYTAEEVEALIAEAKASATPTINEEPAFEEGPHLKGEVGARKRQQLLDYGYDGNEEHLTDDMRRLLKEGE